MLTRLKKYIVWHRQHQPGSKWRKTAHSVTAKTNDEANTKMKRIFQDAGFHSMSLIAVIDGIDPNDQ